METKRAKPTSTRSGVLNVEKVYNALAQLGEGWHGRAELAALLGRPKLHMSDTAALDLLIAAGRIEVERHKINAPIPIRWEYRIVQQGGEADPK